MIIARRTNLSMIKKYLEKTPRKSSAEPHGAEDKNKRKRRRQRRARRVCRRLYSVRAQARGPRRTVRSDERAPPSAAYFRERAARRAKRGIYARGARLRRDTKNGAAFVRLRALRDFAEGSGVTRLCAASRLFSRFLRALRVSRRRPSNSCRGLRLRAV